MTHKRIGEQRAFGFNSKVELLFDIHLDQNGPVRVIGSNAIVNNLNDCSASQIGLVLEICDQIRKIERS